MIDQAVASARGGSDDVANISRQYCMSVSTALTYFDANNAARFDAPAKYSIQASTLSLRNVVSPWI